MAQELGINLDSLKNYEIAEDLRLFPVDRNSENYPGDTDVLGDLPLPLYRKPAMEIELNDVRDAIRIQTYVAFYCFRFIIISLSDENSSVARVVVRVIIHK